MQLKKFKDGTKGVKIFRIKNLEVLKFKYMKLSINGTQISNNPSEMKELK